MNLKILKAPAGAVHRKKRLGRGPSSGHGKTSTRGHKGQKARGRRKIYPWFEGGQMPLTRRVPKKGFRSLSRREFEVVNVGDLNSLEANIKVGPSLLKERGLVKRTDRIKILGAGKLNKPLQVEAHSFSRGAKRKIQEAGGKVEIIHVR